MNLFRETRAQRKWREYRETSHEAFRDRPGVSLDSRILAYLAAHGPAADWEIERGIGEMHQSVSGNRAWLVKDGLVRDSGRKTTTPSGRACIRWEIAPPVVVEPDGQVAMFGGAA